MRRGGLGEKFIDCNEVGIRYRVFLSLKNGIKNKKGEFPHPKCFHNGIILIVICFILVWQMYKINMEMQWKLIEL